MYFKAHMHLSLLYLKVQTLLTHIHLTNYTKQCINIAQYI